MAASVAGADVRYQIPDTRTDVNFIWNLFCILIKSKAINNGTGFEDVEAQGFADDPSDRVGECDNNEADGSTRHHPLGFVNLALVAPSRDPVEPAKEEIEDEGDACNYGQDYKNITN